MRVAHLVALVVAAYWGCWRHLPRLVYAQAQGEPPPVPARMVTGVPVGAAARDLLTGGCQPPCTGSCFMGICLPAVGEDPLRSSGYSSPGGRATMQSPAPPAALAWPPAALPPLSGLQLRGGTALDGLPSIEAPAQALPPFDVWADGGGGGLGASLVPAPLASLRLPPASPPSLPPAAQQAREMMAALGNAEATEASLLDENTKLRRELEHWRKAGEHTAERESKVVQLIEEGSHLAKTAAAAPSKAPPATNSLVSLIESMRQQLGALWGAAPAAGCVFLLSLASLCALVALWSAALSSCHSQRRPQKRSGGGRGAEQHDWRDIATQALTCGGRLAVLEPALRYVGVASYKIEISEIHLGSLLGGDDVFVRLVDGGAAGQERRTKVVRRSDGSFLRFVEVFVLDVRKVDGKLLISVHDDRGELASLELPALELIRLARRPNQEYFRSELQPSPVLGVILQGSQRRPYAAMRIRDITNLNQGGVPRGEEEKEEEQASAAPFSQGSRMRHGSARYGSTEEPGVVQDIDDSALAP